METPDTASIAGFAEAVAAATPAPGGGAVAAVTAGLAAALVEMVAHLALARAPDDSVAGFGQIVESAHRARARLLALASEDEIRRGVAALAGVVRERMRSAPLRAVDERVSI